MSELFIVVGLKAKEGKEDELRRDLASLVPRARNTATSVTTCSKTKTRRVTSCSWKNGSTEARDRHHKRGPHILHFHENGVSNVEKTEFARLLKRVT